VNSEHAYQRLVARFHSWEEVRDAPTDEIAETIRHGGLANIKGRRIQNALHTLTDQQKEDGSTEPLSQYLLHVITNCSPEEAWDYLRSITGVGPKTAACVLLFHLGLPIMPVDTHIFRISQRLGLIGPKVNAAKAHDIYLKITPSEWVYALHVNLITHGREICHAQKPECWRCPLSKMCAYVGNVNIQKICK